MAAQRLLLKRKRTLVQTDAVPRTVEVHKIHVLKTIWIHASRRVIINTDGEEETGKSWMGRGHRDTDI